MAAGWHELESRQEAAVPEHERRRQHAAGNQLLRAVDVARAVVLGVVGVESENADSNQVAPRGPECHIRASLNGWTPRMQAPPQKLPDLVGRVFGNQYRLESLLGRGGKMRVARAPSARFASTSPAYGGGGRVADGGVMNLMLDPSVGVRRRHLPNCRWGGEG